MSRDAYRIAADLFERMALADEVALVDRYLAAQAQAGDPLPLPPSPADPDRPATWDELAAHARAWARDNRTVSEV
jgi:hypothetical protein